MSIRMDSVTCRVTPTAASRPRRQFLLAVLGPLWGKALPMAGRRMCLSRGCEERRAHTIQAWAWAPVPEGWVLTVQAVLNLGGMSWKTTPQGPQKVRDPGGQPTLQAAPVLHGTHRSQWAGAAQCLAYPAQSSHAPAWLESWSLDPAALS